MLQWLRRMIVGRTAVEAGRDNPVLVSTVKQSAAIYESVPLRDYIDGDAKDELARQMYLDINRVCNAVDPVSSSREMLAAEMLRFASLQVLVIPPAPAPDSSGLRGQPGISGALQAELVRLAAASDVLRPVLHGISDPGSLDEIRTVVMRAYWRAYWVLETVNRARIELGDDNGQHDWYRAFMHAACASAEYRYRLCLDPPPATDNALSGSDATAYSLFTDIVLAGEQDPLQEWRDYHRGSKVPMPEFEVAGAVASGSGTENRPAMQ